VDKENLRRIAQKRKKREKDAPDDIIYF